MGEQWDGLPVNPERVGYHWVHQGRHPMLPALISEWRPLTRRWLIEGVSVTPGAACMYGWRYAGPVDPPGTGAALARVEAERTAADAWLAASKAADAALAHAADVHQGIEPGDTRQAHVEAKAAEHVAATMRAAYAALRAPPGISGEQGGGDGEA